MEITVVHVCVEWLDSETLSPSGTLLGAFSTVGHLDLAETMDQIRGDLGARFAQASPAVIAEFYATRHASRNDPWSQLQLF